MGRKCASKGTGMTVHRNFILITNSRGIIRTVISRREAAWPSAERRETPGPMDGDGGEIPHRCPFTRRDGG